MNVIEPKAPIVRLRRPTYGLAAGVTHIYPRSAIGPIIVGADGIVEVPVNEAPSFIRDGWTRE